MNIILIYLLPFIYLEKSYLISFVNRYKIALTLFLLIYLLIFYDFYPQNIGGGAVNKLLFMITDGYILKYCTIMLSFFSFVILYYMFKENKIILIYFILNIFLFCTITPVWQEYFDPISLIFILLFSNKLTSNIYSNRFAFVLIAYLVVFLSASIIDQNLNFFY